MRDKTNRMNRIISGETVHINSDYNRQTDRQTDTYIRYCTAYRQTY